VHKLWEEIIKRAERIDAEHARQLDPDMCLQLARLILEFQGQVVEGPKRPSQG
jgi:hypothetical protein